MAFDALSQDERRAFLAALAQSFHPTMEPQAVEYLIVHFEKALSAIGWEIRPKSAD